jgi:hypothetical protein
MPPVPASRTSLADIGSIAGVALIVFVVTGFLVLSPRDPRAPVAVIFAPGTSAGAAFARVAEAGGRVLRAGPFANIVIAVPDDAQFDGRARQHGAWLVADATLVPGCSVAVTQ